MSTSEKESPQAEPKKRIFEIQTWVKNTYQSTIFLHDPIQNKKVELTIDCKDGVITTEHEMLAQHFALVFKYSYGIQKSKKGE